MRGGAVGVGLFTAVCLAQIFAIQRLLDANLHDYGVELFTIGRGSAVRRIVTVPTYLRVERVEIEQLDWRDSSGTTVYQQPPTKFPEPLRRLACLVGQGVIDAKSPAYHELPIGDVMLLTRRVLFQLCIHKQGTDRNVHRLGFRSADEQLDRLRLSEAYNVGFGSSADRYIQRHQDDENVNGAHG